VEIAGLPGCLVVIAEARPAHFPATPRNPEKNNKKGQPEGRPLCSMQRWVTRRVRR